MSMEGHGKGAQWNRTEVLVVSTQHTEREEGALALQGVLEE